MEAQGRVKEGFLEMMSHLTLEGLVRAHQEKKDKKTFQVKESMFRAVIIITKCTRTWHWLEVLCH